MNANPTKGAQESLPLFVYRNIQKPSVSSVNRGFAGALVLMLIVLGLFILARYIGRDRSKATSRARRRFRFRFPQLRMPATATQTRGPLPEELIEE
jgi:phosphate transport system permease protein